MKKLLVLSVLAFAVLFLFAGCGNSNSSSSMPSKISSDAK